VCQRSLSHWRILPALSLPTLARIGTSEGTGRLRNAKHLHHQLIRLRLICDSLSFVKHLTQLTDSAHCYRIYTLRSLCPVHRHELSDICGRISGVILVASYLLPSHSLGPARVRFCGGANRLRPVTPIRVAIYHRRRDVGHDPQRQECHQGLFIGAGQGPQWYALAPVAHTTHVYITFANRDT